MNPLATTAGTAVAGVLLAVVTAFGIVGASDDTPKQVEEPTVLYGER